MTDETSENEKQVQASAENEEPIEDRIGQGDILEEMTTFGKKLGSAFQSAWGSDTRRTIQEKMMDELKTAGEQVEHLARKTGSTGPARGIQDNASKISRQLGDGLLSGLRALNQELTRQLDKYDRDAEPVEPERDQERD